MRPKFCSKTIIVATGIADSRCSTAPTNAVQQRYHTHCARDSVADTQHFVTDNVKSQATMISFAFGSSPFPQAFPTQSLMTFSRNVLFGHVLARHSWAHANYKWTLLRSRKSASLQPNSVVTYHPKNLAVHHVPFVRKLFAR
jgi:hypothetical protein